MFSADTKEFARALHAAGVTNTIEAANALIAIAKRSRWRSGTIIIELPHTSERAEPAPP
jgi:hypothetical protein